MSDIRGLNSALQELLDRSVDERNVAGINVLVRKDDAEVTYVQSGYADIAADRAFDRDTIMRIYSMSKPITSVAVMILIERGLLGMGEPVSKYLSGFEGQVILRDRRRRSSQDDLNDGIIARPVTRPAYIRDLLCMTSGLPYGNSEGDAAERKTQELFDIIDERLYTDDALCTIEIANRIGQTGLCFQPGSKWKYGTSADILGAIVEVVSGMRFGDFLKKEIFEPLGMKDTGFYVPDAKRGRLAEVYERRSGELELFPTNNLGIRYTFDKEPAYQSGGAGLASTLDDYARFAQMLLNGGVYQGHRILNEATVRYMTHGALTPAQREWLWKTWDSLCGYDYGCLMRHALHPEMAYFYTWQGEYGWDGWLGTFFANVPDINSTILIGMQISNPEGNYISEKVRNIVAQYL